MATEKAYFEKIAVRPDTKLKIKILAIFHPKRDVVAFMEDLINDLWRQAEVEEKVNDHMLAEPVGSQPPAELQA